MVEIDYLFQNLQVFECSKVTLFKENWSTFSTAGGFVVSASFMLEVKMPWVGSRKASGWTVKLQLADVPDAQAEPPGPFGVCVCGRKGG